MVINITDIIIYIIYIYIWLLIIGCLILRSAYIYISVVLVSNYCTIIVLVLVIMSVN